MLLVANAQAKEAQAAAKAEQAAGVSALTEGLVKHISSFDIKSFIFCCIKFLICTSYSGMIAIVNHDCRTVENLACRSHDIGHASWPHHFPTSWNIDWVWAFPFCSMPLLIKAWGQTGVGWKDAVIYRRLCKDFWRRAGMGAGAVCLRAAPRSNSYVMFHKPASYWYTMSYNASYNISAPRSHR